MLQAPALGSLAVQPKWLIRVVLNCCLLIYHVHVLKLSPQLITLPSDMQIKTWLAPTLEELFTEMTKLPRRDTSLALNLLMWPSVRQPIPKQMSSPSKYAHFSYSGLDNGSYSSEIDLAYFFLTFGQFPCKQFWNLLFQVKILQLLVLCPGCPVFISLLTCGHCRQVSICL